MKDRFPDVSPSAFQGIGFTALIEYDKLTVRLSDRRGLNSFKTSAIQSVKIEPNGYTKLALRRRKDFLIPTTHNEAVQLVKRLNAVLLERRTRELRKRQAYRESVRKRDSPPRSTTAVPHPMPPPSP